MRGPAASESVQRMEAGSICSTGPGSDYRKLSRACSCERGFGPQKQSGSSSVLNDCADAPVNRVGWQLPVHSSWGKPMNKQELIDAVAAKTGSTNA